MPAMTALVEKVRAPFARPISRARSAQTDSLLYRRGNFNGTFDDLICDAMLDERDAEIALSPWLPLGRHAASGRRDHLRGADQRDRDHLSDLLSQRDDGRAS